ncbi:MAG: amidohydrolase [Spirochaetes bacterium]|nr:MAG: amidohydrolase [Spirochaetota bacterium]
MMKVIDFHAHAFPDKVAEMAIPSLEKERDIRAKLDGKVSSLLDSMDSSGIDSSVVASIATRPEQFGSILNWSKEIVSDRIIPFASVHPDDPDALVHIEMIASAGLKGVKLHPYYQKFTVDEQRMYPVYKKLVECNLILLLHTGYDLFLGWEKIANPERVIKIAENFPDLKLVTSHFGAWQDWEDSRKYILGKPIYMDIAFSIHLLGLEKAKEFLITHPSEYILFGTDSPWADQKETLDYIDAMNLQQHRKEKLLWKNAEKLLSLTD